MFVKMHMIVHAQYVFSVFAGLITAAFSFILSLSSPVNQVEMLGCFALICMCDSVQLAELRQ